MSFLPSARSSSPHREGALSQAVYSPREQERALCAPNRLSPDRRKRGSQEYERSFTPLDLSITQLARGTFSPREFALVERSWRDTQNVEISPLGKDSSVYFMSVHGEKRAVIKIRQDERGSPRHQEISDNMAWHIGCPSGTGAFVELLVNSYMQENLQRLEGLSSLCVVPNVSYAQMGHPSFAKKLQTSQLNPFPCLRGTGVIQQFIPGGSPPRTTEALNERVSSLALEFLAAMDIVVLHQDRHENNLELRKNGQDPEVLVVFDNADCLPVGGGSGVRFCWEKCDKLKGAPSERIQEFVQRMDGSHLEKIAGDLLSEISSNVQKLPMDRQGGEIPNFAFDRILPHKIALCFMQKAVRNGWSFSQIGKAFRGASSSGLRDLCPPTLIPVLYKEVENCPRDRLEESIQEICQREVGKGFAFHCGQSLDQNPLRPSAREESFSFDSQEGRPASEPVLRQANAVATSAPLAPPPKEGKTSCRCRFC